MVSWVFDIYVLLQMSAHSEDRIKSGIAKLKKAKGSTTQGRLDSFFKVSLSPTKKRKVRTYKI